MPVQPLTNQHAAAPKNINIAVLYSKADEKYWDGLKKHFTGLANLHKNVRIWAATDVELGGEVLRETKEELKKADITLMLISPDFINDKIIDGEARFLLETYAHFSRSDEYRKNERFIVPVLLNHLYGWEDIYDEQYDIEDLRVFDKILSSSDNLDEAYARITKSLEEYIERINAKGVKVVIPTWIGFIPGIMYNDGFVRNKKTGLFQKYKRELQFTLNDDLDKVCDAFRAGEANLIWSTIDRLPYVIDKVRNWNPRVIYQASWSNGADAILARKHIQSVQDLKGKRVHFPLDSPSQTFLHYVLREHNLSLKDVQLVPQRQANLDQLSKAFIADERIDALVLWSPFVEACLTEAKDVHVLAHSGQYPNLIADVLISSEEYIGLNREELGEMLGGWLLEVRQFIDAPDYQQTAVNVLIEAIIRPLPAIIPSTIRESLVEALSNYFESSLRKVHLCTLEDNRHFFGLAPHEEDALGRALYNKFLNLEYPHLTGDPGLQWENIVDASLISELSPD
ncbi:MAG: ABC transporter substrate-binding protein [Lewinellaceae bacterium]|nr:ABC transporter substrate-binding protein [Lewinellaceae bacterium]